MQALKFKSDSVPSDKNVTQNTRPFLYTYVKVWAQEYMCYTVPGLCIQTVSSINLHLQHPKVKKAGSHRVKPRTPLAWVASALPLILTASVAQLVCVIEAFSATCAVHIQDCVGWWLQIAEGIIMLAWHKQQIVIYWIIENVSSTLLPLAQWSLWPSWSFVNHDAQGPNHHHFEIKILNVIMTFFV